MQVDRIYAPNSTQGGVVSEIAKVVFLGFNNKHGREHRAWLLVKTALADTSLVSGSRLAGVSRYTDEECDRRTAFGVLLLPIEPVRKE